MAVRSFGLKTLELKLVVVYGSITIGEEILKLLPYLFKLPVQQLKYREISQVLRLIGK